MRKKGQITLYLVIAAIMLIAFGVGFSYLVGSNHAEADQSSYMQSTLSLDSDTKVLQSQVQSCLQDKTLEGIDYFGLKESSQELINDYIAGSMEGCVNFRYFEDRGYAVERLNFSSSVVINDDAIISTLDYPISMMKDGKTTSFERFEYNLQRQKETQLGKDGVVKKEIRIVTEDGDAEFIIPKGTTAHDAAGNPIEKINIRVEDKNLNGLKNSVVIGNEIYVGQPDGAVFSPEIKAVLNVNYDDIPTNVDPYGLKCGFYDPVSDIWRTYKTTDVVDYPEDKAYSVKCDIGHFTMISVLQCGNPDSRYEITIDPFIDNPIKVYTDSGNGASDTTEDITLWTLNDKERGGEEKDKGFHLIPEAMGDATCEGKSEGYGQEKTGTSVPQPEITQVFTEGGSTKDMSVTEINLLTADFYSGDKNGVPLSSHEIINEKEDYCGDYLLQDWDKDDRADFKPEVFPVYSIGYYKYNEGDGFPGRDVGDYILLNTFTKFDPAGFQLYPDANADGIAIIENGLTANELSTFKDSCLQSCIAKAKAGEISELSVSQDMISGDGINDLTTTLFCPLRLVVDGDTGFQQVITALWEEYFISMFTGGIYSYHPHPQDMKAPECMVSSEISSTSVADSLPFDNIADKYKENNVNNGKGTMEYPKEREVRPFYATPKTYGYAKTNQHEGTSLVMESYGDTEGSVKPIGLGGYGQYAFEMRISGGSCVQGDDTPERVELTVSGLGDAGMSSRLSSQERTLPVNWGHIIGTCSDSCIWTLNDNFAPYTQSSGQDSATAEGDSTVDGDWSASDETSDASSVSGGTSGKIQGGMNFVRNYVSNNGAEGVSPDTIFYSRGKLIFTGVGLILEDKCGTTLSQRLNYLLYNGVLYTGKDNIEGRESNCLYTYVGYKQKSDNTWNINNVRLCGDEDPVDFKDPAFRSYYLDKGVDYCRCMAYVSDIYEPEIPAGTEDPAKELARLLCIHYTCPPLADGSVDPSCINQCKQCGNFDLLSPNGGSKRFGDTYTCPDILDPVRDVNCVCGPSRLEPWMIEADEMKRYCCAGDFTDELPEGGIEACRNGNTVKKWCASISAGKIDCSKCLDSENPPNAVGGITWVPIYNNECP